jgi:ankyrin repeat protein
MKMSSKKVCLILEFEGITRKIIAREGLSWAGICEVLRRDDNFPGATHISHLVLLDSDGGEYSSPLKTEAAVWKIVATYSKTPGYYFKVVTVNEAEKAIAVSPAPASNQQPSLQTFIVVFNDVRSVVSVAEDVTWDDLVAQMVEAVSAAGSVRVRVSHIRFVDEDDDSLSPSIESVAKFWKFIHKIKTSFRIKLFANTTPFAAQEGPVAALPTKPLSIEPVQEAAVVFNGVHGTVSVPKDATWDVFTSDMSQAVSAAGTVRINYIQFVDADGDSLSSKISSMANFWKFVKKLDSSWQLRIHGTVSTSNNGPCDVVAISHQARDGLSIADIAALNMEFWDLCKQKAAVRNIGDVLKRGAYMFSKNSNGSEAIHFAAISGDIETLMYLVSLGCDVRAVNAKGFTPLHIAVNSGTAEAVKYLLSAGADIYKETSDGYSALAYILGRGVRGTLSDVYETHKFDLNYKNSRMCTLLHMCCSDKGMNPALAEELLELGADIELADSQNRSPLFLACMVDNTEVAKILLRNGANLSQSALFLKACAEENTTFITHIIAGGVDLNSLRAENGITGMHLACDAGAIKIADALAMCGVAINERNSAGLTPFLMCCDVGQLAGLDWLHSRGVDINQTVPFSGNTGLHLAAMKARNGAVNWLLQHHVDTTAVNFDGLTAQELAINMGNSETSELLSLESNHTLDDNIYSIPGMGSSGASREVLAPVVNAVNRAVRDPAVSSIFDDFLLSFSCLSDSSHVPAKPVTFGGVENLDQ